VRNGWRLDRQSALYERLTFNAISSLHADDKGRLRSTARRLAKPAHDNPGRTKASTVGDQGRRRATSPIYFMHGPNALPDPSTHNEMNECNACTVHAQGQRASRADTHIARCNTCKPNRSVQIWEWSCPSMNVVVGEGRLVPILIYSSNTL
jgi:hypothetical protein